ncbi:MAG: capsule assembly Wzi family protein [Tannerella sp.]|nr:capsule assembly Wzi family protein [Tannerella sp.]
MKRIRLIYILFMLLVSIVAGYAQDDVAPVKTTDGISYRIKTFGSFATNGQTPFWLVGNQQGMVPINSNNGYLQAGIFHSQSLGRKSNWKTGLDMVAVTPRYRHFYIQQLYTEINYQKIRLSIGSRNGTNYHSSLLDPALSSGDLGISTNARPIPEIKLFASEFIPFPWTGGWLQGKGDFAVGRSFDSDYLESFVRTKQNYIRDILWHHKSAYLRVKDTKNDFPASLSVGIQHIAQWGGVSTDPSLGKQPQSARDFIHVILGRSGGENASLSDQINVQGSHYGTYDVRLGYEKKDWSVFAYYQHLFYDHSGIEYYNGLDGMEGIQLNLPKLPWMSKVVIEYISTLNQSGPFHYIMYDHSKYPGFGGGGDNYYNNGEYTTGASYFNRGIGSPLLFSPEYNANGSLGFKHNRIRAWHLGAEGHVAADLSYRLLLSTMESYGTAYAPTLKKLTNASFTTDFSYHFHNSWIFTASIAGDWGSTFGNHLGCGISVTKWGILK